MEEFGIGQSDKSGSGLEFRAEIEQLITLCYCNRFLSRVLAPLAAGKVSSEKEIYQLVNGICWEKLFKRNQTFAVRSHLRNGFLNNSLYLSQLVKDAIVDRLQQVFHRRPNVQRIDPQLLVDCRMENDSLLLSLDLAGLPFYQRGYRRQQLAASLKQNLAAALVAWSCWNGESLIADLFCGAGTILFEAVYRGLNLPGGYLRKKFGFMNLPEFDHSLLERIKKRAEKLIDRKELKLLAVDQNPGAIAAFKVNWLLFPEAVRRLIKPELRVADFRQSGDLKDCWIISNPPYGQRLETKSKLFDLYKELGDFLKHRCPQSRAFLLVGDLELIKRIGLRPAWRKIVYNGRIECRFLHYLIY